MKRFWNHAATAPVGDRWQVTLDGKPMRLPSGAGRGGGAPLLLASRALADAVADEWQQAGGAKGGEMSFADTPLTRLAGTAQQRVAPQAQAVAEELARYGESDLLCYRADGPDALVQRQADLWQPWLNWAEQRFGVRLVVTTGIMHVAQNPAALARLAAAVAALPVPALAALGLAVPNTGSLVLGLALAHGALDATTMIAAAQVDEQFQAELWGMEQEAEERRQHLADEITLAARFLFLSLPA